MIIGNKGIQNLDVFALTITGARHKDGGICEDASLSFVNENMAVIAVADGHGDSRCFRANVGAELACKVAINSCKEFLESKQDIDIKHERGVDKVLNQLKTHIIFKWNEVVLEDLNTNKLLERELALLTEAERSKYEAEGTIDNPTLIYGTTLLVYGEVNNFWFGMQVGDGDLVTADKKGAYVLEKDPKCIYTNTTSICEADAIEHFYHLFGKKPPKAVFLCTDGLRNSFANEKYFLTIIKQMMDDIKDNGLKAKESISKFFDSLTEIGSRDDISIATVYHKE